LSTQIKQSYKNSQKPYDTSENRLLYVKHDLIEYLKGILCVINRKDIRICLVEYMQDF